MARTTANATSKGPEGDQVKDPAASGVVADGSGAKSLNESGGAADTSMPAADSTADGQGQQADSDNTSGATVTLQESLPAEPQPEVHADDKGEVTIYPLRSYLDGKEIRRAGGKGYKSPKHDAVSLIAAGLATDKKPKA